MKIPMNIHSISAGIMQDSGTNIIYASAMVLSDDLSKEISDERIDVGVKFAKVKINTDDNNILSRKLASTFVFPFQVLCDVSTVVKKGEMVMQINSFDTPKA